MNIAEFGRRLSPKSVLFRCLTGFLSFFQVNHRFYQVAIRFSQVIIRFYQTLLSFFRCITGFHSFFLSKKDVNEIHLNIPEVSLLHKCIRQVLQNKSSKKVVNQRCRSSKPLRHNSAIGERQMLPWQTKRILIIVCILSKYRIF